MRVGDVRPAISPEADSAPAGPSTGPALAGIVLSVPTVLALQRTAGNAAVTRLLRTPAGGRLARHGPDDLTSHVPEVELRATGGQLYLLVNGQSVAEGMVDVGAEASLEDHFDRGTGTLSLHLRLPSRSEVALSPTAESILSLAAPHHHLRIERQATRFEGDRTLPGWETIAELGALAPQTAVPPPPTTTVPSASGPTTTAARPTSPPGSSPVATPSTRVTNVLQHLAEERWDVDSLTAELTDTELGSLSVEDRLRLVAYIGGGYVVGDEDETTIVRLLATTPAGARDAVRTQLVSGRAAVLQTLESAIDGEEYAHYHGVLRQLMMDRGSPERLLELTRSASVLPWSDPGLIHSAIDGYVHYEEPRWTPEGRVVVRYSAGRPPMMIPVAPIEFAPDQIIGVYFITDDPEAGGRAGQTLYTPAVNILSLYHRQFRREMWTAVNVGLAVGGVAGVAGATGALARILAALDATLGVAAIAVDEYRREIARTPEGRQFLAAWDRLQTLILIYTAARVLRTAPQAYREARDLFRRVRGNLSGPDAARVERELEQMGRQVDDAERALQLAPGGAANDNAIPPGSPPRGPAANDNALPLPPPANDNARPVTPAQEHPPATDIDPVPQQLDLTGTDDLRPHATGPRSGGGARPPAGGAPPRGTPPTTRETPGPTAPPARPTPGLPTPAEDAVIRRYIEGLATLRERREALRRAYARIPREERQIQSARSAVDTANRLLEDIEHDALTRTEGELLDHLNPFTRERQLLNADQGLAATTTGTRVACAAVRSAPPNLRGMDLTDIEQAIGRPPDQIFPPGRPTPGSSPTSHGRLVWDFPDGSELIVDAPRATGNRAASADLPHAELHGPRGERLDNQGIEVPERSIAAHMTITDHRNRFEDRFAPARGRR